MASTSLLDVQFQIDDELQTANAGRFPKLRQSLPYEDLGGCLSWCPVTNLIAFAPGGCPLGLIGASQSASRLHAAPLAADTRGVPSSRPVALFLPSQPSEHTLLHVPTAAPHAPLLALEWSPLRTRRALLAVDPMGTGHIWTQGMGHDEAAGAATPYVTNSWRVEYSWDLPDTLVARWLSGSCEDAVAWPPQPRATNGPGTASPVGLASRFGGHPEVPGAWNYPELLLVAAVTATGKLQLHWSQFPMPAPHWAASAPTTLGLPGPLVAADVALRRDGTLTLAAVTASRPGTVHLVQVHALVPDGRGRVGAAGRSDEGNAAPLRPGLDAGVVRVCELFGLHRLAIYAAYREPVATRSAHIQTAGGSSGGTAGAGLAATWGVVPSAAAVMEEARGASAAATGPGGGGPDLPPHGTLTPQVAPPPPGGPDASSGSADGGDGSRLWRHAGIPGDSYRGGGPGVHAASPRAAASSGVRPVELVCEAWTAWDCGASGTSRLPFASPSPSPFPSPHSVNNGYLMGVATAAGQEAMEVDTREAPDNAVVNQGGEVEASRDGVGGDAAVPGGMQQVAAVLLTGGPSKELSVVTVTVGGGWQQQRVYTAERWSLQGRPCPLWDGFRVSAAPPSGGADTDGLASAPASDLATSEGRAQGGTASPGADATVGSGSRAKHGHAYQLTTAHCVAREIFHAGQGASVDGVCSPQSLYSTATAAALHMGAAALRWAGTGWAMPGGGARLSCSGTSCVVVPSSDGTVLAISSAEGAVWCVDSKSLHPKYALTRANWTFPSNTANHFTAHHAPWSEGSMEARGMDGSDGGPWELPGAAPVLAFSPNGCCLAAYPPLVPAEDFSDMGHHSVPGGNKHRVQILVVEHVPLAAAVPPSASAAGGMLPSSGDSLMLASGPVATAAAALATAAHAGQGPRRVKALPPFGPLGVQDMAGWAAGVADRIWWSVLSERHPWDAIQVALAEQHAHAELVLHVLRVLDDDFHALPPTTEDEQRLFYSHVLDKVKSELLRDYARFHTGATAVLEDMQARLVLSYVTSIFRAAMLHPPAVPPGMPLGGRYDHLYEAMPSDLEVEPSLLPALEPWVQLLVDIAFLFVDDVKRFFTVLHRSGSRGVAAASQDYGTIPAVWLLRDRVFLGTLCELLLVATAVLRKRAAAGHVVGGGALAGAVGSPAVNTTLAGRGPNVQPQFGAGGAPGGMMSSGGGCYTLDEARILHAVIAELHKGACSQPALPANAPLLPTHMHVGSGAVGSTGGPGAATPPTEAAIIPASPGDPRSPAVPPLTPGDTTGADGANASILSPPPPPSMTGAGAGGPPALPAPDASGPPGSAARQPPASSQGPSGAAGSHHKAPAVCLHYSDGARMPEWGRLTKAINSSPLQYLLRRTRAGPSGALQTAQQLAGVAGAQVPPLGGAAAQRGMLSVGTGAAAAALLHLGSERHVVSGLPSGLQADQRALQWSLGHILERCGSVMRQGARKRRHADGEGALEMATCPWSKPCRGWWDVLTGELRSGVQPRWLECVQCRRRTSALLPADQGELAGAPKAAADTSAITSQGGARVAEASTKAWFTRWNGGCPVCGGAWKFEKNMMI
eukprot:jgi/Mesvir1/27057/Mv20753-RA.1